MLKILLIATGGGLGSVLRWWLQEILTPARSGFPWAIFLVNVSGCLLFGLLHGLCQDRGPAWQLALLTGFLGGYTTFSTFGYQTFALLHEGRAGLAVLNAIGSVVAGVLAVWLGVTIAGHEPSR